MTNIPTAEDFILQKVQEGNYHRIPIEVESWLIEFAKIHCSEQSRTISEKAKILVISEYEITVDKESILTAYPLENIK